MRVNLRILCCAALLVLSNGASGADMPAAPHVPAQESRASIDAATQSYLELRASLFAIRARFDVITFDDISGLLADEARQLGPRGPEPHLVERTLDQLRAEGTYYIVSLRYLIESGGAVWPDDRPAADYRRDALVLLDSLQFELESDTKSGKDPISALLGIDRVNSWTEGYGELPDGLDHFGDRQDFVRSALAAYLSRTAT